MPSLKPRPLSPRMRKLLRIFYALCLAAMVFFGARTVYFVSYWAHPSHREQMIEPWMTVGYVARSYGVDKVQLAMALGLTPQPGARHSLGDLARRAEIPFEDYALTVRATAEALQRPTGSGDRRRD